MTLEITRISKTYRTSLQREVKAVEELSLSVKVGEFVTVHGPSGSGKTTLLLIAGGLLAPDSGSVRIAGKNPYELDPDERASFRASSVGFVFQQFHLVPYLSVLDNVLAPAIASKRVDCMDRAQKLISEFGLNDRITHLPSELSTGERQRTALARALLNEPKLLLADEPTGNLDRENSETVLTYLTAFVQAGGAVLLVTHEEFAKERAGRLIELQKLGPSPTPITELDSETGTDDGSDSEKTEP